ncbi:hypothetical protein HOS99_gp179 [Staphylococcus phage phiSA_BS1]|uniref:Uncharacterized protein n=2 Tax=Baoshanvirus TaxID=2732969 RepID=A0A2P1MXX7_9CAUD|nr:hypothetical protein HOS99_gp179 [Staphylococcus phage phiSA_BS1]YP_009799905.1 hypothetical protein HOT02_gp065 [Staphylococcus phage phiSA_BS2]AVP40416.1 hypothetical protein [Staphylococcus phage phiSA_BS1]AVR55509.1 hypothetical protein phiSABS2_65 [Staphylococcus phage phiSA_BS2]WFG34073.1 hypothetical protein F10086_151 [Staphylococcus phage vB_SauM_JDF86]
MNYDVEGLYEDLNNNYKTARENKIVKSNPHLLKNVEENLHEFDVLVKNSIKLSTIQKQQLISDMTKSNDYLKSILTKYR